MISKAKIEEVLAKSNIVDFIQERVDLKRSGSSYKALCPFHDEKTPSMIVTESKQIFKCFGCGAGGNVINFIMQYESLTYPEAIRFVAEKVGVEIIEEKITDEDQEILNQLDKTREELYATLNKATTFFHYNLLDEIEEGSNTLLLNYLKKRNITIGVIEEFKLGFAFDSWDNLLNSKAFKALNKDILLQSGLIKKNDKGGYYDFFRKRLLFPIFDSFGNTIAFSARVLDDEDMPKYLNSPDSLVYKKNSVLFGFYHAKNELRKQKKAILVEGNLDQIALYKYGFKNSIATCGTAYTEEHSRLLKRNCDQLFIALDSDKAGYKASLKAIDISLKANLDVRVVNLPKGEDPDSFLEAKGAIEFSKLLDNSQEFIDYYLTHNNIANIQNKILVSNMVLNSISQISDEIKKEIYLNDLAVKTNLSIDILKSYLQKLNKTTIKLSKREKNEGNGQLKNNTNNYIYDYNHETEFSIIYLMLTSELAHTKFKESLNSNFFTNQYTSKMYQVICDNLFQHLSLAEIIIDLPESFTTFFTQYSTKNDLFFNSLDENYNHKITIAIQDNFNKISRLYYKRKKAILKKELETCLDSSRIDNILLEITQLSKAEQNLK